MTTEKRRGATGTGYGLVVGLIAIVALVSVQAIGSSVDNLMTSVGTTMDEVANGPAFRVAGTVPDDGATNMGATVNPSVNFTRSVDLAAGADLASSVSLTCGGSSVSLSPSYSGDTVSFNPDSSIDAGASCTASVAAGTFASTDDQSPSPSASWSFTTRSTSNAFGWGDNNYGETGVGSAGGSYTAPTGMEGALEFTQLGAGDDFACGLLTGGGVRCWGRNHGGQLGNEQYGQDSASMVTVSGGHSFTAISVAGAHVCALTASNDAYCWGGNSTGQLGQGVNGHFRDEPNLVIGGHSFAEIAAGNAHTCALTIGEDIYCWGRGDGGQRGTGSTTPYGDPTPTLVLGGLKYKHVASGGAHSCGITTTNDTYCWGRGGNGRLGNSSAGSGNITSPVQVDGGHSFTSITAGWAHTCGLVANGDVYCWGLGSSGQRGDGSTAATQYTPTLVTGGLSFSQISAGREHTCGLAGGNLYCCGLAAALGDAASGNESSPVLISGASSVSKIYAGFHFTIGVE